MFILCDVNEQATNPKVVSRLREVFPNLDSTQTLAFGDVNIILDDGSILAIERKRASDFLGSIADGRVFRQVERMANGAKWSCIILEGTIEFDKDDMTICDGEKTQWRGSSVRGAMLSIMWSGCPIIFSSQSYYPNMVADIYQFCCKPEIHHQSLGRKRIVTFPPIELKEEIVAAFPGIGLKRARSLFEFTESKNNGASTLAEAFAWISAFPLIQSKSRPEGWGDKTVENFRVAMGLKANEFLDIKEDKNLEIVPNKSKEKKGKKK